MSSFTISKDKAYFATGSEADECNIKFWRVSGLDPVRQIENAHDGRIYFSNLIIDTVCSLVISNDNSKLFSSAFDSVIKCWNMQDGACLYQFPNKHEGIQLWPLFM